MPLAAALLRQCAAKDAATTVLLYRCCRCWKRQKTRNTHYFYYVGNSLLHLKIKK
jgi:hypothetical protein